MKFLSVSDIHDRTHWQEFILQECLDEKITHLLLPGDVLDGYKECGLLEQKVRFRQWIKKLNALNISVTTCCGNHDRNLPDPFQDLHPKTSFEALEKMEDPEEKEMLDLILYPEWIKRIETSHHQAPGTTKVYGDTLLTSLKYNPYEKIKSIREANEHALTEGIALRRGKVWIVIHHVPPPLEDITEPKMAHAYAEDIIDTYRPEILLSGHYHYGPKKTGNFSQRKDQTLCLNAGQVSTAEEPNRLIINTQTREILWKGGPERAPKNNLTKF